MRGRRRRGGCCRIRIWVIGVFLMGWMVAAWRVWSIGRGRWVSGWLAIYPFAVW